MARVKDPMKHLVKNTLAHFNIAVSKIKKPAETLFELDEDFNDQYDLAQRNTQMSETDNVLRRQRHYTLYHLLRQVDVRKGHVAECGCFRGLSAYQIASYLKESNFPNKFYLFDSFEGLSKFNEQDIPSEVVYDIEKKRKQFACSLEAVKQNLKDFSFIEYKKGWIPDRFKEVQSERFSFIHIDVDLYQPILDSIQFFYPLLIKGGIMVFDDYGCLAFPGAKRAVDKFMDDKEDFFLSLPSGEAFLVKE